MSKKMDLSKFGFVTSKIQSEPSVQPTSTRWSRKLTLTPAAVEWRMPQLQALPLPQRFPDIPKGCKDAKLLHGAGKCVLT